jgi:hypothetical protein
MKTLTNKTTVLSIEYPRTWDESLLTDVSVQIADFDGTELLASTSADLYTSTTLDADSLRYTRSITLAAGSDDLVTGDLIRIRGILGYEDHVVKGYDASNLVAELESHVDRDFENGASVDRLSAIATVDLSDTDVFAPGTQIVITWTPTGTGDSLTELAEIETDSQIDVAEFTTEFSAIYSRAYNALKTPADRLDTMIGLAQNEIRLQLSARGLDIARIKDQRLISPLLMAKLAEMWARDGDESSADEHQRHSQAYSAALESLCQLPIWIDLDGDGINDDGETQSHPVYFERVW